MIKGYPGAIAFREVRPDYIDCPHCGHEMEVECIGLEVYGRLRRARPSEEEVVEPSPAV